MRISTYIRRTDFITALTVILFQICLLALWGELIYAAITVWTFCFGYPDRFWELALFAALAGVLRVQGNLKLRRS
ncbi:MAG: hypothetical protein OXH03_13135 [Bacteroidetes bacterium]|nr:hypothetical protein [Bacteroidota bacterium]MDE2671877.1 hypothetical protein [Bacteroidota bacterium]